MSNSNHFARLAALLTMMILSREVRTAAFLRHPSMARATIRTVRGVIRAASTSIGSTISAEEGERSLGELSALESPAELPILRQKSIQVSIYVDPELREHLGMRNQERKGKVFLSKTMEISIENLRGIIEKRFPSLDRQPFAMRVCVPNQSDVMKAPRQFKSNDELTEVADAAERTSAIHLYACSVPGTFPPPSLPYLIDMPDPSESSSYTILSFYKFSNVESPEELASELFELWKPFKALGRVYVAKEGVNAQCAVPTTVVSNFKAACDSITRLFGGGSGVFLNVDHELTREAYELNPPFKAMHIRVRDQIVADGFDAPLDWDKSGREMPPMEWHEQLDNPEAVVLDCRNSYESDVGVFNSAIPLNTTFFRESWDALREVLKDTRKDAPIMTYCTGGIRCVKINAFLEQQMGFTNVSRLQGGVISYTRELMSSGLDEGDGPLRDSQTGDNDECFESDDDIVIVEPSSSSSSSSSPFCQHLARDAGVASKFKGVNYVFDERMGARITADVLSTCESCGQPWDIFTNCDNTLCHIRFIQCKSCSSSYRGCCSKACQSTHESHLESERALRESEVKERTQRDIEQTEKEKRASLASQEKQRERERLLSASNRGMVPRVQSSTSSSSTASSSPPQTSAFEEKKGHASSIDQYMEALTTYCERKSTPELPLLAALREETCRIFTDVQASRMLSGPLQGRLLTTLVAISGARRILELGTFTGYSAISLAEGIALVGDGDSTASPVVVTCESDPRAAAVARDFFGRYQEQHSRLSSLLELREGKAEEIVSELRKSRLLSKSEKGDKSIDTFDLVFIDADKKAYFKYFASLLGVDYDDDNDDDYVPDESCSSASLLSDGAIVILDNTLWKGLVLGQESDLSSQSPDPALYGDARRMTTLAKNINSFNDKIASLSVAAATGDSESKASERIRRLYKIESLMLPIRDGLTVVRVTKR